ncbi:VRR-NUC domain-containing protein [Stenotrophomonas maltophilia]|uniref:VRR-NUC domain-containing protein n=1 Tax=Stenotrophomonas maltophilia TaxID=40324 RepID=UPI0015DF386A|nr:VRR-NUC domain-containing protein [Stenotrophomonas maltophilia]
MIGGNTMRGGAGTRPRHPEDAHQKALFDWVAAASAQLPDLQYLMHVPNGGRRGKLEAARLKAQGVRAGYPDLVLDVARGEYHGLRIELKATRTDLGRKPEVSAAQRSWLTRLQQQGYRAVVCEGWLAAREELLFYLALEV